MSANWLIERDVFNEGNPERMIEIIRSMGMKHTVVGMIPFSKGFVTVDEKGHNKVIYKSNLPYRPDECVVVYGSINLCQRLYNDCPWTPTAWFNLPNMTCRSYYSRWGQYCLQRHYIMLPFGELQRQKDFLFGILGRDHDLFLRPDANLKTFSGTVVREEGFDQWFEMTSNCYSPDPDALVVACSPQRLSREWRFVIKGKEVVTGSLYKVDGEVLMSDDVHEPARAMAAEIAGGEWSPEPIYVMDICETASGELRLLEIGDVNCAGLYKCDLKKVIVAMKDVAEREWIEIYECDSSSEA